MADDVLRVTALPAMVVGPRRLAVGMNFAEIAGIITRAGDETAPHFVAAQEPNRDGTTFASVDGQSWYRPDLRVADRPSSVGPYVWFGQNAEGVVRLEFELEEQGPGGAGAHPFAVTIDSLALTWHDTEGSHTRAFANPTIIPAPDQSQAPRFRVHAGDQLSRDEVQAIYRALSTASAAAQLAVGMSYGYWIDSSSGAPAPPAPRPDGRVAPLDPRAALSETLSARRAVRLAPATTDALSSSVLAAASTTAALRLAIGGVRSYGTDATAGVESALAEQPVRRLDEPIRARVARIDDQTLAQLILRSRQRLDQHDFHRVSYTRSVAFYFDPELSQNSPIYRAIRGEELTTEWTETSNGWLRRAAFPNTVYRLPDELRLAFNTDLGVPHVFPTLYRDEAGDSKVRVVMRIMPWHDPRALAAIGDELRSAPDFVVGGYESASLTFTGAFPDQIHALSGTTVPISLERGSEVTLDLSVEFYTFLCQLLTGPVGVTGSAAVTLGRTHPTDGTPAQPIVREVAVRLGLGVPASLPLDVSVPPEAVSPAQVSLANRSGAPVTIGGCEPRLLQYDHNSVVPLDIFHARATSAFPVSLAAGASVPVDVTPLDPDRARLWNAVLAQLLDVRLDLDPQAVLERIYEVAPVGTLEWELGLECPPLASAPGPARFVSVIAVDVQVTRPDGGHVTAHLARGSSTARLTMRRTLAELTSASGDVGTFSYAVRNLYDDHAGRWSSPQSGEGSNLTVYPNDPNGD